MPGEGADDARTPHASRSPARPHGGHDRGRDRRARRDRSAKHGQGLPDSDDDNARRLTQRVTPSGSTTLTASVRPGLLVGPIGNVKFTDSTNGALLGTIKPKLMCLLRLQPCVATLTVPASALAAGDNTIVAAYSGGLFTKPSSASADVFAGTQNTCQSGSGQVHHEREQQRRLHQHDDHLDRAVLGDRDGSGVLRHRDPALRGGGRRRHPRLQRDEPRRPTKTVTLALTGAAADQEHQLDPGDFGNVCFGAPAPFETNTGGQARRGPTASSTATCRSAMTRTATTTMTTANQAATSSSLPARSRASTPSTRRGHLGDVHAGFREHAVDLYRVIHHDGEDPKAHG